MNKSLVVAAVILVVCAAGLGFNTLDWMAHRNAPETWCFVYPQKLCMPFWYAYFFGGILPLWISGALSGVIIGIVLYSKQHHRRNRDSKKLRIDLDPTVPRVLIIAILLFVEALCIPAYTILQTNAMPTDIQWLTFLFGAIIQLVTFLMAFVKGEETKETT